MVKKSKGGKIEKLTFEKLLEKAKEFHKNGIRYSFHVLMKEWMFNENKANFVIAL